jgi:hypothetical protein
MSVPDPQPLMSVAKPIEPHRHRPAAKHGARPLQLPASLLLKLQSNSVAHRRSLLPNKTETSAETLKLTKTNCLPKSLRIFWSGTRRHEILIVLKPTTQCPFSGVARVKSFILLDAVRHILTSLNRAYTVSHWPDSRLSARFALCIRQIVR